MKQDFKKVFKLISDLDINGCITGSYMLGYHKDWNQDIDVFCYDKSSFTALLYYMHYSPMFLILDPLEKHKYDEYTKSNKSSLDKLGLITIKFKYNMCIDVNVVYKEYQKNIFEVLANFDLDIITIGYDIKTGETLSLRQSEGMTGTWNKWNKAFYDPNYWTIWRLIRQFERIVKYTDRGYNLESVVDKYISLIKTAMKEQNIYKSEKGTAFHENMMAQLKLVHKILVEYKKVGTVSEEGLKTLKTII